MTGVTPKPVNQQPEIGSLSLYSHISTICKLASHLLFLGQGEMSPGGDGHPAIAGVAASAHDAQPVIVTHSAVAIVAELIDFIWKRENNILKDFDFPGEYFSFLGTLHQVSFNSTMK